MTKLLEDSDYRNLGVNDLMNKAAEVIRKGEVENKEIKRDNKKR